MPQEEFIQYCDGCFANFDSMEQLKQDGIRHFIEMTGAMDPNIDTGTLRDRYYAILGDLNINSQEFYDNLENVMQYRILARKINELREQYNSHRMNNSSAVVLPEQLSEALKEAFEQYKNYGQKIDNKSQLQKITEFEGKIQSSRILSSMCDLPSLLVVNNTRTQLDLYETYSNRLEEIRSSRKANSLQHSLSTRASVIRSYRDYMSFMIEKDENGISNKKKIAEFEDGLILKDFFKTEIKGKGVPSYDINKLDSFDEIMTTQVIPMGDISKVMYEREAISRQNQSYEYNFGGPRAEDYLDPVLTPGKNHVKNPTKWTDYLDPALIPEDSPYLSKNDDETDR